VNQAKDLDENLQLALQRTVHVYLKCIISNQIAFKLNCSAIPTLGVVMLLRLLMLNIFQLMIHDFQDHNHVCSVVTVCFISYIS
jgi:hypothetical protein